MNENFLDPRQLEAFVAVLSVGSMTGAAKALGKSQPAISRLIQELEQEVGFSLLHRNGPRISPTEQGIAFFAQAELFLGGLRTISERARQIESARPMPIEIAAVPALCSSLLPSALAQIDQSLIPLQMHIQSIASENVIQAVLGRTADIGLASLPLDYPGLDVHWVGEVPCVAIVAEYDVLAERETIRAQDLVDRRLILSANPYRLRAKIQAALEVHHIALDNTIDCNATYVSLALARKGLGVGIVEAATLSGLPLTGVKMLPLAFHIPYRWGVITAAGRPLSRTTEAIIAAFDVAARRLFGYRRHEANSPTSNI
jgi:DNA-binding transcriptional LysR family regulator